MAHTVDYSHPDIGTVKGTTTNNTLQFCGVQYASLRDRFAPPEPKEYSPSTTIDATTLGPQVLSFFPNADAELGLIQHDLPYAKHELRMSDTDGLCLNITAPATTRPDANLPVFVFIHGGGFFTGSATWPQYDMRSFVRLSVDIGKPIVAVVLNYRLGAPGLLYSSALKRAGYAANNTLHDQRAALRWIQRHIAGFGGDPANVTLAGESAGSVSVCYHLFAEERLFARVVCMSGTHLLIPPMTAEEAEAEFGKAVRALGLEGKEEGEVVEALNGMEGGEMVGRLMGAGLRLGPVVDGDVVPCGFTTKDFLDGKVDMPGLRHCQGAMIGDCAFDGSIRSLDLARLKEGIAAKFCAHLTETFSSQPDIADRWLALYDLNPSTPDDEAFVSILHIANDLNFYHPTLHLSRHLRTEHPSIPVHLYRFNVPNPWPGPWQGQSNHILDISFLFQNFNAYLGRDDTKVAWRFAEDVVGFVNGEVPWAGEEVARVYGAQGVLRDVRDVPAETGRRAGLEGLAEVVGWDGLNGAFAAFSKA